MMRRLGRYQFDPANFDIVQEEIKIKGLPPAFQGYRIVQVSDLHTGHWLTVERLHGVVELINDQNPDMVAITGDFISYELDSIHDDLVKALANIQAVDGTVAVLGNHDHWFDPVAVRQILARSGVIELPNDVITIIRGTAELHIAGVDDIIVDQADLPSLLDKMPANGPAILLAHEPDFADISATTGRFALQLSGHSHGTQIIPPGMKPIVRGPGFSKYPKGRYQVGPMVQYTNRGIGTHILRLRINCPPEITVFSLA